MVKNAFGIGPGDDKKASPPLWGPNGYTQVNCYYLPQLEVYYLVPNAQFIFLEGDKWTYSINLPSKFRGVDLYRTFKVALADYSGKTPQEKFAQHKAKYGKITHWPAQETIGRKPPMGQALSKN